MKCALMPIVLVFFILSGTGEAYGTCWALWGFDAFHWNGRWIGLSLGTFGVSARRWRQGTFARPRRPNCSANGRTAVLVGLAWRFQHRPGRHGLRQARLGRLRRSCPSSPSSASAHRRFQSPSYTELVDPARQGQFQGVLASAVSLASIVAPLAFSTFYFVVQKEWPGAIWLSVVVVNAIAVPLVVLGTRTA